MFAPPCDFALNRVFVVSADIFHAIIVGAVTSVGGGMAEAFAGSYEAAGGFGAAAVFLFLLACLWWPHTPRESLPGSDAGDNHADNEAGGDEQANDVAERNIPEAAEEGPLMGGIAPSDANVPVQA